MIVLVWSSWPDYPDLRILILTIHDDEALVREAIKAGASGYILKHAAESELVSALGVLMRGDMYDDHSLPRWSTINSTLAHILGITSPQASRAGIPMALPGAWRPS